MNTMVQVPKAEYQRLNTIAKRFELLQRAFTADFFASPSTKNGKDFLKELTASGKHNKAFLKSVSAGIKESSYFR